MSTYNGNPYNLPFASYAGDPSTEAIAVNTYTRTYIFSSQTQTYQANGYSVADSIFYRNIGAYPGVVFYNLSADMTGAPQIGSGSLASHGASEEFDKDMWDFNGARARFVIK